MEIKGKEAKDTYRTSYVFHLPDIPLESIEKYRKDAIRIEIRLDGEVFGNISGKNAFFSARMTFGKAFFIAPVF